MKKFIILSCFIVNIVSSQTIGEKNILNFKNCTFVNDSLVFTNGTASNEYYGARTNADLDFDYLYLAFGKMSEGKANSHSALLLKHWTASIQIYIDPTIDKNIKKKLIQFITKLSKLNILEIKIVNKKRLSNYIVETTHEKIEVKNVGEKIYPFYEGVNYKFIPDSNNKILSCNLQLNTAQVVDKDLQYKKLKQFFYLSLVNFIAQTDLPTDSISSIYYNNNEIISEFDVAILKHHYKFYNQNPVNVTTYNKIQAVLSKNQTLQEGEIVKIKI